MAISGCPPRAADAAPTADSVFILPGASPDAWAPEILGRIDAWATGGTLVRAIDADYYRCAAGCSVSVIPYPRTAGPVFGPNAPFADQSIAIGVDHTRQAIGAADGRVVVAGLSLGSLTADAVQRSLDADPDRPPAAQVTFIVAGDPSRVTPFSTGIGAFLPEGFNVPVLGWTATRPPADSPYDTVVVVGEYDIIADFPDRPWNLLALANGVLGFSYAHGASALSNPSQIPPQNITMTTNDQGGTTTTYLMPGTVLPMLRGLTGVLPEPVISAVNSVLKPIVDRAYSRNDATTGNRLPYLQPTGGLPRLVFPNRVTPTAVEPAKPVVARTVPKVPQSSERTRNRFVPTGITSTPSSENKQSGQVRDTSPARVRADKFTSGKKTQHPRRIAARAQHVGSGRSHGAHRSQHAA
jgi:hypothetical protein